MIFWKMLTTEFFTSVNKDHFLKAPTQSDIKTHLVSLTVGATTIKLMISGTHFNEAESLFFLEELKKYHIVVRYNLTLENATQNPFSKIVILK